MSLPYQKVYNIFKSSFSLWKYWHSLLLTIQVECTLKQTWALLNLKIVHFLIRYFFLYRLNGSYSSFRVIGLWSVRYWWANLKFSKTLCSVHVSKILYKKSRLIKYYFLKILKCLTKDGQRPSGEHIIIRRSMVKYVRKSRKMFNSPICILRISF